VITPETPGYESSRLIFNRAFEKRPALIVRCAGADDVARALEFSRQHNLPVAIRGGGHNRAGLSVCDGGVVIDLASVNRVDVDPISALLKPGPVRSRYRWTRRRGVSALLRRWLGARQSALRA
jgi:FAD/FMN-containing dehydrogenase